MVLFSISDLEFRALTFARSFFRLLWHSFTVLLAPTIIALVSFIMLLDLAVILDRVSRLLSQQGYQGYAVGGLVRDWLLGRGINDIDIAVNGDATSIARKAAGAIDGKFVLLDEVNKVARVVVGEGEQQWELDFSSFANNVAADLARRDFTINALAAELSQLAGALSQRPAPTTGVKLIDPFSGESDLKNGTIRAVSPEIFERDPARLLRAVRLAAELNFVIEPETEALIRRCSPLIASVPGEKTREELLKVVSLPGAARHLRYLDELGLLPALFPELAEGKGVEQPRLHFWDVFNHSLQTVAAVEFLIREDDWEYGNEQILAIAPWSEAMEKHLSREVSTGSNGKVMLKLGGLFHDVAKPRKKVVDDNGGAHFYGHAREGADMTVALLKRLRFSKRETDLVESLVCHHLRPMQMAGEGMPTQRAIYRYFRDTADAGSDILILALADYLASRGPLLDREDWEENCRLINYIITEHDKQQAKVLPEKLIDGHDLINIFGLAPGPLLGELLELVREAQASGEVAAREGALALVRKELSLRGGSRIISTNKG